MKKALLNYCIPIKKEMSSISLKNKLLRPLIPLVLGLLCLFAEGLLAHFLSKKSTINNIIENHNILNQLEDDSILKLVFEMFKQLREYIFHSYHSYLHFMGMMTIVNICLNLPKMVSQALLKTKTLPMRASDKKFISNENIATSCWNLLRFAIVNSCCFILYYLIAFSLITILLDQNSQPLHISSPIKPHGPPFLRTLAEEGIKYSISGDETLNSPNYLREVTTLNVPVISILLSNDGKTAFLCQLEALLVIDISEIENPKNRSSLHLPRSDYCELSISLTDSVLVMKRSSYVHLVNVTNIQAPILAYSDMPFGESNFGINYYEPSIVISADGQTAMFAEDGNMKIVNISNLTSPTILNKNDPAKTILYSSVAIYSSQKQVLFSGWASFRIYNLSDLANPIILKTITFIGDITSISLSADQERLYFICTYLDERVVLYVYDVTNLKNPIQLKLLEISNVTYCKPVILNSPSKENNYLYISLCDTLKVVDLSNIDDLKQTLIAKNTYFGQPYTFALSLESKTSLQAIRNKLVISRLYFNIETETVFDLFPRILGTLNNINLIRHVAIAPDNKAAFLISNKEGQSSTSTQNLSLHLVNISNYSSPTLMKSFTENIDSTHIQISTHQNLLLKPIPSSKGIEIYKIADEMNDIQKFQLIEINEVDNFLFSADGNAIIVFTNAYIAVEIWNISDLNSIELIHRLPLPTKGAFGFGEPQVAISADRKYLFYLVKNLHIIELESSTLNVISTINLQVRVLKSSFVLSSDEKTLYIVFVRDSTLTTLETYDITNIKSPVHLSSFPLPRSDYERNIPLTLSPDNRILVMIIDKGLLALDVAKPSSPNNYRFIRIAEDSLQVSSVAFSKDGQSLFISTGSYGFQIIDLKPQYLLMTPTENYKLGKTYSSRLALLQRSNNSEKYNPLPENYKFIKFSQYSIDSLSSVDHTNILYPSLPSWMNFDKDNGILNLEPKSQWSIGSYNLYAYLSNRISPKSFIGVGSISNESDSKHLLSHLVSQNYIDNQLFLTPNFQPNTELLLDERFSPFQGEISKTLGAQIFEVLTQVTVHSSLSLSTFERLSIQTPSPNSLTVALKFHDHNSICQFASRVYSAVKFTITDNKTFSVLEGPLFEINNILTKILINLENNETCGGSIAVSDGLNPPINVSISNMSNYFTVNQAPTTNSILLLQDQINNVSVLTGQHFIIELDPKTFQDINNVSLEYELVMQDKLHEKPNWLSFRGLSLMGTPPESLYLKSLELAIVARNEFKAVEIPFTLSIKVSFVYAMKLVFVCFGYLFTVYKVWKNYGFIYNILGKKYYRYPKDYYLTPHQEVDDNIIPPILFIAEEMRESDIIFENLLIEIGKNSVSQSKSITEYFKNLEINERMLFSMIKTTVDNFPSQKKQKLKIYLGNNTTRKNIIETIILNKIISLMLRSEQKTKNIFDKLKDNWTHFVKYSSPRFIIDTQKLNQELSSMNNKCRFSEASSEFSEDSLNSTLLTQNINIQLLQKALLAYAFEHHNMNVKKSSVKIKSKQKIVDSSCWYQIKRFLKMDLHSLKLKNKDEIGFGIKYKLIGNSLHFCGFPNDEIQGEKLLVQIGRSDDKILREIWLIGIDNQPGIEQIEESL